jgi:hypothetical protein
MSRHSAVGTPASSPWTDPAGGNAGGFEDAGSFDGEI